MCPALALNPAINTALFRPAHGARIADEFEDEIIGLLVALRFHVEVGQGGAGAQAVALIEPDAHGAARPYRIAELVLPHMHHLA